LSPTAIVSRLIEICSILTGNGVLIGGVLIDDGVNLPEKRNENGLLKFVELLYGLRCSAGLSFSLKAALFFY
jgi:hypothetical protein